MKVKNLGLLFMTSALVSAGSIMSFAASSGAELVSNYKAKIAGAQSVSWAQSLNNYDTSTDAYSGTTVYKEESFSTVRFSNGCEYKKTTGETGSTVYGYTPYTTEFYRQKTGDNIHNVEMQNGVVSNVTDFSDPLLGLNALDSVLNVHGDETFTTAVDGAGNAEYVVTGYITKDEFSKSELSWDVEEMLYRAVCDISDAAWNNPTYKAHFDATTEDLKSVTVDLSPIYIFKEQQELEASGGTSVADLSGTVTFNNIRFNEGIVVMPA